jgi:hypothetical protein
MTFDQVLASSTAIVAQTGAYLAQSLWAFLPVIALFAIPLGLLIFGYWFFVMRRTR